MVKTYTQNLDEKGFPQSRVVVRYDLITGEPNPNKTFYDYTLDKSIYLPTKILKSYGTSSNHPLDYEKRYEYDEYGRIKNIYIKTYYDDGITLEKEEKIRNYQINSTKKIDMEKLLSDNIGIIESLYFIFFNEYEIYYLDDGETIESLGQIELDQNGDIQSYKKVEYYDSLGVQLDPPQVTQELYFEIIRNENGFYKEINLYQDYNHINPYNNLSKIVYTYDEEDIISKILIYRYIDVGSGDYWYLPFIENEILWLGPNINTRWGDTLTYNRTRQFDSASWITDYQSDPSNPPEFDDYYLEFLALNYDWNEDSTQVIIFKQQYNPVSQELEDVQRKEIRYEYTPENIKD
jgi:hypothetical protein